MSDQETFVVAPAFNFLRIDGGMYGQPFLNGSAREYIRAQRRVAREFAKAAIAKAAIAKAFVDILNAHIQADLLYEYMREN
jgi:hypothetical protein